MYNSACVCYSSCVLLTCVCLDDKSVSSCLLLAVSCKSVYSTVFSCSSVYNTVVFVLLYCANMFVCVSILLTLCIVQHCVCVDYKSVLVFLCVLHNTVFVSWMDVGFCVSITGPGLQPQLRGKGNKESP